MYSMDLYKHIVMLPFKHFKLGVKPFRTFASATKILSVLYDLKMPYVETTFSEYRFNDCYTSLTAEINFHSNYPYISTKSG